MPADNFTEFDESAESMALLGQHDRIPDPTAALVFKSDHVPQRLQSILSQCQTESEIDRELWDDLEIHRRSADTYVNRYLDCLQQVHLERPGLVHEIVDSDDGDEAPPTDVAVREPYAEPTDVTRAEWRLKILRDSIFRDLLAMHETLGLLKTRDVPSPSQGGLPVFALSFSTAMINIVVWPYCSRGEALCLLTADVAGTACYFRSRMWKWLRSETVEHCRGSVEALFRRVNKGDLNERNRADLYGMSFWMIDHFRT